jgi:hypothetical protein
MDLALPLPTCRFDQLTQQLNVSPLVGAREVGGGIYGPFKMNFKAFKGRNGKKYLSGASLKKYSDFTKP